jgi:hypothetical protein
VKSQNKDDAEHKTRCEQTLLQAQHEISRHQSPVEEKESHHEDEHPKPE